MRIGPGTPAEAHRLQHLQRTAADEAEGDCRVGHLEGEDHVLKSSEAGKEAVVLEDEPRLPAHLRDAAPPAPVERAPVYPNLALARAELSVDQPEEGRLPGAAWPEHEGHLARAQLQVDGGQDLNVPETVAGTEQPYEGIGLRWAERYDDDRCRRRVRTRQIGCCQYLPAPGGTLVQQPPLCPIQICGFTLGRSRWPAWPRSPPGRVQPPA